MTKTKNILDGREIAAKQRALVKKEVERLAGEGHTLTLATLQVGQSKDAALYAHSLTKLLAELGIHHIPSVSKDNISEAELIHKVVAFNSDPTVTGIMVFAPLPPQIHTPAILAAIDLMKDVEGRRVLTGFGDRVVSPTANAVLTLLEDTGIEIAGKDAVVIGHSDVVGKPTAILLLDRMATVTVCHVKTKSLENHVRNADIVVAAAGKPNLVKGEWIRPGAVVIDVGENVVAGKLVGDVEFETAKAHAAFISPVPGGVGPVTNVMLVKNLLKLRSLQKALNGNS